MAALIVIGGVLGFEFIMKLQMWITVITAVLTVIYVILVASDINFATLAALPAGPIPQLIGGFVFMLTGFGLGWVNAAGDYSRYLPRHVERRRRRLDDLRRVAWSGAAVDHRADARGLIAGVE